MADIIQLLTFAVQNKASDLHLSAGMPPMVRINGDMRKIKADSQSDMPAFDDKLVHDMVYSIMPDTFKAKFEKTMECDFSFEKPGLSRFRVNIFKQSRGHAAVFRMIPSKIMTLKELATPPLFAELMERPKGLILVTGPTGSGKSTTLAAMIDYYNANKNGHILTIEDPIEFVHNPNKSLINQREIGSMTQSFDDALRSALREDPDVILVGEMRDLETIRLAMTAAETGHLVLGTLHSSTAAKTVNRIIDVFPENEKDMIRTMLSESLEAVISQTLLKTKDLKGRVAAHEVMVVNNAIRNLIRENKVHQIYSSIQTGGSTGMQSMEQCLKGLVNRGIVDKKEAEALLNKERVENK